MSMQADNSKDQFRRLLVLIAVATVDMVGGSMVFPLIPFYALKLHASPPVIGMIISSFFVAQLISAPLWGRVSDHYGRRPARLVFGRNESGDDAWSGDRIVRYILGAGSAGRSCRVALPYKCDLCLEVAS